MRGPAVLVPVKAFADAKVRLAPALGEGERAALARSMATRVVAAASPLPVAVACDDDGVRAWAVEMGADVVWTPGLGLNRAVEAGVAWLRSREHSYALVVHGDLPRATGLAALTGFAGITLVPDRRDDGTNVIGLPLTARTTGFRFAYGPCSFARHLAEARAHGDVRIARVPDLQWDVDVPADLAT